MRCIAGHIKTTEKLYFFFPVTISIMHYLTFLIWIFLGLFNYKTGDNKSYFVLYFHCIIVVCILTDQYSMAKN